MNQALTDPIDDVINWLSPYLKGSIDRLLATGVPKYEILMAVREGIQRACKRPENSLTLLAVRRYLATKQVNHVEPETGGGGDGAPATVSEDRRAEPI